VTYVQVVNLNGLVILNAIHIANQDITRIQWIDFANCVTLHVYNVMENMLKIVLHVRVILL
jgi:hypothetical protein